MTDHPFLDLRQYRYFHVLAKELHFAKAAERLGISQPALSQQIRLMERLVGADLLIRHRRHVALTEVGIVLFEQANTLLQQADHAHLAIANASQGNTGRISISYVASAALSGVLPRIIYEFRLDRSGVQIVLQEQDMLDQIDAISQGVADIGIIRPPIPGLPDGIVQFDLLKEPMVVALRTTHRCAQQARIDLSDLADDTFICTHRRDGIGFYDITLSACHKAGFVPKTEVFGPQTSILISMVAAGFGVALVPESARSFAPSDVVFIPLSDDAITSTLAMVYAYNNRSPAVQAFLDTARTWAHHTQHRD
jgi:DNA-binding transcriptional LysR family regulator